jgi:hypothetical protein
VDALEKTSAMQPSTQPATEPQTVPVGRKIALLVLAAGTAVGLVIWWKKRRQPDHST